MNTNLNQEDDLYNLIYVVEDNMKLSRFEDLYKLQGGVRVIANLSRNRAEGVCIITPITWHQRNY
jgi:exonuclease I